MADTYVKTIVAAIAARVDAAGKPQGLVVKTARTRPAPSNAALKQISIYPVHDGAVPTAEKHGRAFPMARRVLTVELMHRCAGTDLDNETLRAWTVAQLMADLTLGGLAVNIEEADTSWQGEMDSTSDYSEAALAVEVEYARPRNTLERA